MATTIMNVTCIMLVHIWYALMACAPNDSTRMLVTTNALASMNMWKAIGIPTLSISHIVRRRIAARSKSCMKLLKRGLRRTYPPIMAHMQHRATKVATPAPTAPIGSMPNLPNMRTQFRNMFIRLHDMITTIAMRVLPMPSRNCLKVQKMITGIIPQMSVS